MVKHRSHVKLTLEVFWLGLPFRQARCMHQPPPNTLTPHPHPRNTPTAEPPPPPPSEKESMALEVSGMDIGAEREGQGWKRGEEVLVAVGGVFVWEICVW